MTLKPLGDSAWLVEFSGDAVLDRVRGLMALLEYRRPSGVRDVVASFASVAVHFDGPDGLEIRGWLETAMAGCGRVETAGGAVHEIPVCYDGECAPDLAEVAERAGLSVEEVIALHSGAEYSVAAVGFSPGFPYLTGLPGRLWVPRKSTPRLSVPAGSVAVAGGQAGIYPFASPGGWNLLGRTNLSLFDPHAERPALLQPGDRVRFKPVGEWTPPEMPRQAAPSLTVDRWVEVIHPGGLTTVQDFGRPGYESAGVSPGGAVDRMSMRLANLLVGNHETDAVLEICVSGPVLKFQSDCVVAMTGRIGKPQRVKAGEVVDFSRQMGGVRAYLAVAGGWQVPMVMGSAATDVRAGFGGYAGRGLMVGDRLGIGRPGRIPQGGDWSVGWLAAGRVAEIELRFVPGVQEDGFDSESLRRFRSDFYQVTPASDRMGARLSGPVLA